MNPTLIGILGFQVSAIGGFIQLDPTTQAPLAAPVIILIGLLITIGAVVVSTSSGNASGEADW